MESFDRFFFVPLPQKEPVWINFICSILHNFFTYCGICLQTAVCCEVDHRFLTYDQPSCELVYIPSSSNYLVWMCLIFSPSCSCLGVRIQWFRIHTSLYVKCGAATIVAAVAGRKVDVAVACWSVATRTAVSAATKDPAAGRAGL